MYNVVGGFINNEQVLNNDGHVCVLRFQINFQLALEFDH